MGSLDVGVLPLDDDISYSGVFFEEYFVEVWARNQCR